MIPYFAVQHNIFHGIVKFFFVTKIIDITEFIETKLSWRCSESVAEHSTESMNFTINEGNSCSDLDLLHCWWFQVQVNWNSAIFIDSLKSQIPEKTKINIGEGFLKLYFEISTSLRFFLQILRCALVTWTLDFSLAYWAMIWFVNWSFCWLSGICFNIILILRKFDTTGKNILLQHFR